MRLPIPPRSHIEYKIFNDVKERLISQLSSVYDISNMMSMYIFNYFQYKMATPRGNDPLISRVTGGCLHHADPGAKYLVMGEGFEPSTFGV